MILLNLLFQAPICGILDDWLLLLDCTLVHNICFLIYSPAVAQPQDWSTSLPLNPPSEPRNAHDALILVTLLDTFSVWKCQIINIELRLRCKTCTAGVKYYIMIKLPIHVAFWQGCTFTTCPKEFFLASTHSWKHATLDKLAPVNDLWLWVWVVVSVLLQLSGSLAACCGCAKPWQMPLEIMSSPLWG